MIAINLLPEDRRPVERTPLPRFMVIVGGVAGFSVEVVMIYLFLFVRTTQLTEDKAGLRLLLEQLQRDEAHVVDLENDIRRIKQRAGSVQKLIRDRRVWAPILHHLTDPKVLPSTIWFDKLRLQRGGRGGRRGAGPVKT